MFSARLCELDAGYGEGVRTSVSPAWWGPQALAGDVGPVGLTSLPGTWWEEVDLEAP